jgi:long-chain acyl-CoA synthetase
METRLREPTASEDRSYQTVPDLLADAAARFAERPALWFMGRRWHYRALGERVDRLAAGLQRLGVGPGVKVGLCLPNTPYSVMFFYAVLKAGAVVVNYNPLYVAREIAQQMADSDTAIMVVPDLARIVTPVLEAGAKRVILCPMRGILPPVKALALYTLRRREIASLRDQRIIPLAALLKGDGKPAPMPIETGDLAVLQYTGGTTGTPKGAMLSHANLLANMRQTLACGPEVVPGEERMLAVLPLFHVIGMTLLMNCSIAIGAEIILLPRFSIEDLMRVVKRTRPTIFPAVPTIVAAVLAAVDNRRAEDIASIRLWNGGGAAFPAELCARLAAVTGKRFVEAYGLSETAGASASNTTFMPIKPGSVGRAVAGATIEIRDPEHPERILGVGEKGEICIRGPQVMMGYWNRPEETARAFIAGALRTGDIGYLDDEGYLFIVDRLKDVIIAGGYNIYPRVIEEALCRHPAVAEAMVIGVPDSYRGETPKAFVTLRPGARGDAAELLAFLDHEISRIEMPREIEIRETLPKTAIGKLSKKALHEEEARLREGAAGA